MDRYDILEYLEGKQIRVLCHQYIDGKLVAVDHWTTVKDGEAQGQYGVINLRLEQAGVLEHYMMEGNHREVVK